MSELPSMQSLIDHFQLRPLDPEGGYFTESYRAPGYYLKSGLPSRFQGDRRYSTAIYYLLSKGVVSRLHRIAADEVWHFYFGGPITVVEIFPDGRITHTVLGSEVLYGQKVQHMVPAGCWFGAYPNPGTEYGFVGCTVAPGFDYEDFELGAREALLREFPHARSVIHQLT